MDSDLAGAVTWQFPPVSGGADYGFENASSAHFSDHPVQNLVREIIQNSLDAKESGLFDPVKVTFTETEIERGIIGADELRAHLVSCMKRTEELGIFDASAAYRNSLLMLESANIPCLKIVDSGTTGLRGSNWEALTIQEGFVRKEGAASGGSYGIGKNAVFNLSSLFTVLYSTRYLDGRRGREERMQGKSRLITHESPESDDEVLQHIGFYRELDSQPIRGKQIPDFFRLDESGTGVFIIGFDPGTVDWSQELLWSVLENFFYAIHHKMLIVEIQAPTLKSNLTIDHETIDHLFQRFPNTNAYCYYQAIREASPPYRTPEIDGIGTIDLHVSTGSGPRRTAFLNRNGMLITDSRERHVNPIAPLSRSSWPDYVAVAIPATDVGDRWIRAMENPGHDSISPQQIRSIEARASTEDSLRETRNAIRTIIDQIVQIDQYGNTSNLHELAATFPAPDFSDLANREIETSKVKTSGHRPQHQSSMGFSNKKGLPKISGPRLIQIGSNEMVIAFIPDDGEPISLTLRPAGDERSSEDYIFVTEATVLNEGSAEVSVAEGMVILTPVSGERIQVRVVTNRDLSEHAFTIQ